MTTALLIVDIQNDYFPGGRYPLAGPEAAAARAAELLDAFRAAGRPTVHIQHIWDAPDAAFMAPGTPGVDIHPSVAPRAGERVVQKHFPNSFRETGLHELLQEAGVDDVVVCGMMSNLCVDATSRAAADLGYALTVAHDACAASALVFLDREIPAADVHAAFMAGLDDYGAVVSAGAVVDGLSGGRAAAG